MMLPLEIWIIFFSTAVSIYRYNRLFPGYLRFFSFFLLLTLSVELTGFYLKEHFINNYRLYNLFTPVELCFYSYIYYHALQSARIKKIIRLVIPLYLVFFVINILFLQNKREFDSYTETINDFLISAYALAYFYKLILKPPEAGLYGDPLFWISTGLLLFYAAELPYMSLFNFLEKKYKAVFNDYYPVIDYLNIIMYSLFAIGFLCKPGTRK